MELKKIREIRLTKEYLPGFAGGNDPVPGFNGWQWRNNIYNSVFDPAPNGGVPEQWYGPTPGIVEGNVNGIKNLQFPSIIEKNVPAQEVTPGSILIPSDNTIKTKLQEPLKRVGNGTPKSAGGGPSAASIGSIVSSGLGFAGAAVGAFGPVRNEQELLANAGTTQGNVNGFGYQKLNEVDANREYSELSKENTSNTLNTAATGASLGASVGSIVPGVGTALGAALGGLGGLVTGLFGGSSRKARLQRKIFNANQQAIAKNNFNRASAHSDFLALDYAYNHTNTQDDILYGAKHGKDCFSLMPGYFLGKDVYTAGGLMNGPANARVAFGETIYEPGTGDATIVKHGKLDLDTNLANLKNSTVVFGNDVDVRTGKTFRDEALPYAAVLERLKK